MNAVLPLADPPPPQLKAADPRQSVFVTANAGSGKTTTLVQRVARLLLNGSGPEALLCVTYTKAAAAEMQTRLFETLGRWSVLDDDRLRAELEAIDERPHDLSLARTLFARALETPGGLKIQTIHAFCEKLLRRFPLEAGVSPAFEVLEDAAAAQVSAAARDALARLALADPDGPVGRAYAHLAVEYDLRSFEGLLAAFESRRADIAAYADRCEAAGEDVATDVWRACGFPDGPSDPAAIEAEHADACDWARWADAAKALSASGVNDAKLGTRLAAVVECSRAGDHSFADCLKAFSNADGSPPKKMGTKAIDPGLIAWLEAERDRLHDACALASAARMARDTVHALTLARVYAALYAHEKRRSGALDFADLIAAVERLLTVQADAAWVLYKLDGGVDHVLVDEAQDTAPEQWAILRALTGEFFAGYGKRGLAHRTVFAVGDEKQSIYSFQGAAPERLEQERRVYEAMALGAGEVLKGVELSDSWRSTPEVLSFVDAVFATPDAARLLPHPAGAVVVRHRAARESLGHHGCVDLWPPEQETPSPSPDAWDAPLDAKPADSAFKRLARRIATWVVEAGRRGEAVFDKESKAWRPVRPGDVLILVRRRDVLFEEIIRALKKAGVPVAGADRLKLSEHIVFQDVLSLCRFVLFQHDDLSLAELLRSPLFDIDEAGLFDLAQPRTGRLWPELRARAAERPEWAAADGFLAEAVQDARARTPFDWLARTLNRLDGEGRSMRQRILTRLGREAEDALDEILAQALSLEARGVRDLERFIAALERSDLQVKRELEAGSGEVRVMTVHGAKGLEAPVVILPDTTTRPPPGRGALLKTRAGGFLLAPRKAEDCEAAAEARQWAKDKVEEEALRLLYVALTRARDRVIVCGRTAATAKGAVEGCWYKHVELAFERPEIAGHARTLGEGETAFRRYGPDPLILAESGPSPGAETPLPGWAAALAAPDAPELAYASPSELAARKRGPAPSPLATSGGVGRFRRGDLIHRLLQLLPDLPDAERDAGAARLLARAGDLSEAQRAEMAASALAVLRDPVFAEVFGPGSRAEVAVAGGAPDLPPGLAISGRVDRMVVTPERVLVVDFKTNRPAPPRIERAEEAYRIQMAVYVAVLRAVFPGRPVEAALVWTDGPLLMPVPEEVIAAALAALPRTS